MIPRVKGTHDILDLSLYNLIIEQARAHLTTYAFTQISTPVLEPTELFKRSLGIYTDVVSKEMFTIASHKQEDHDDETICLRPEATASVARAFIEHRIQHLPWKVWMWGPMFRYERPQKGRLREFNQIDIEAIGVSSVLYDAHFIKMLDRFFHEKLLINNYALTLNFLGCAADRIAFEKILKTFLDRVTGAICANCKERKEKNILRIFDCKVAECQAIYQDAPHITDALCVACAQEWQQLQLNLDFLAVSYIHKPTLVRGLDYYSKTVFEFVSGALGAQNAFCAGGRYDQLIKQLGGNEDQPSIGAALGLERLVLIMQTMDRLPHVATLPLHVVIPISAQQQSLALLVADMLQASMLATEVFLEGDSVKSMMRKANKLGAKYCLLLGDDEQRNNEVTVKNMVTGTEERIAQVDLVAYLRR